jgi:hypothetical protein
MKTHKQPAPPSTPCWVVINATVATDPVVEAVTASRSQAEAAVKGWNRELPGCRRFTIHRASLQIEPEYRKSAKKSRRAAACPLLDSARGA